MSDENKVLEFPLPDSGKPPLSVNFTATPEEMLTFCVGLLLEVKATQAATVAMLAEVISLLDDSDSPVRSLKPKRRPSVTAPAPTSCLTYLKNCRIGSRSKTDDRRLRQEDSVTEIPYGDARAAVIYTSRLRFPQKPLAKARVRPAVAFNSTD